MSFTLDNSFSLSEDDTSFLRRTSFIAKAQKSGLLKYFTAGLGLRLNLSDNLGKLRRTRPQRVFPIKSDAPDFADRFAALDTGYAAFTHTLMPDTHISAIGGYLDENFFGMGGEILYRPHNARFAIGAEGWTVNKRNPFSTLNLKTRTGNLASAHINAWYDIPEADITLGIKTGRYLAEDFGATLSLTKNFKNGAKLEGFMTISDEDDTNGFQGRTHTNQGLRLSLPLGGYKYTPNSDVKITAEPFGRDIGQTITNPTPLYEVSEPFSTAHTTRHWDEINKHTKN